MSVFFSKSFPRNFFLMFHSCDTVKQRHLEYEYECNILTLLATWMNLIQCSRKITKWFYIKEKNVIYCLWIEWHIFPYADMINKLQEKKIQSKFRKPAINRKMRGWRGVFVGLERQYKFCNFWLKEESRWSFKRREVSLVTQANLTAPPYVFSGCRSISHKRVPATEER